MSACAQYEIVNTPVGAVPRPMLTFSIAGPTQTLNLVGMMDSVTEESPVTYRLADGFTRIDSFADFFEKMQGTIMQASTGEEVKILSERVLVPQLSASWYPVHKIIRHKYRGKIVRLRAIGGLVDVTPNHSIFLRKRGKTYGLGLGAIRLHDAKEAEVGDGLDIVKIRHMYPSRGVKDGFFVGTTDLAWLYGFFLAEGSAYFIKVFTPQQRGKLGEVPRGKTHYVSFSNKDIQLLEKAKRVFEDNFHAKLYWNGPRLGVYKLHTFDPFIYNHFRSMFYTGQRKKKVPYEILNAPEKIKHSFLDGYNVGDGGHSEINTRLKLMQYQSFTTNSWVSAAGLLYLAEELINQSTNINWREDKPDIVGINFNTPEEIRKGGTSYELEDRRVIKKVAQYDYDGYVYDLETHQHRFTTGVGNVMVHNSGSDITLIPLSVGQALGFNPQPQVSTFGVSGSASGQIFNTQVSVAGKTFTAPVFVSVTEDAPILLGRAGVWSQFDSFTFYNTQEQLCFGPSLPAPLNFTPPYWQFALAALGGGIAAWLFLR